jgi:hypothetical protein
VYRDGGFSLDATQQRSQALGSSDASHDLPCSIAIGQAAIDQQQNKGV